jgi:sugar/nucleoside kinase (ribokinase family)
LGHACTAVGSVQTCNLQAALALLQTDVKDTNGAGDTFATTYMLAMAVNDRQPGVTANWAASRAVAQPQVLFPTLGCVAVAPCHAPLNSD